MGGAAFFDSALRCGQDERGGEGDGRERIRVSLGGGKVKVRRG